MTINQCAPGCGLGRPGEGAVARHSRGKIDNIRWGGGVVGSPSFFDRCGQNRTISPVKIADNMTIKRRTTGFGLKRLGDCVAASFYEGDFCRIFGRGGGRIHAAICKWAGEFDRTARSPTSATQQSTSARGGGV